MSPRSPGAGAEPQRGPEARGRSTASTSTRARPAARAARAHLEAGPPPRSSPATSAERLDGPSSANALALGSALPGLEEPRGLVLEPITGQAPESLDISEIDPLLTDWRVRKRRYHQTHATQAERAGRPTLAAWHQGRADTLAREYAERVDECETEARGELRVWCKSCGEVHDHPIPCRVRTLCEPCGRKAALKRQKRVVIGLERSEKAARYAWNRRGRKRGQEPRACLLTMTVRHVDPETDRDVIAKAWPNFRRALLHELGGGLEDVRGERHAPDYVAGWEITPGTKGDGHVHLHAAFLLPWVDRDALKEAWERLTDGEGTLDMATRGQRAMHDERITTSASAAAYTAKHGRGRIAITGSSSRDAAWYAAKAMGRTIAHLSPKVAAAWVRIAHARRMSTTSRRLLVDIPVSEPCQCGGSWGVNYERPDDGRRFLCRVSTRGPPVEA